MTTQVLCTTGEGVQTIRKDFKKRSEVKIKGVKGNHFHTIRFNNTQLQHDDKYLNWENYNCCGGWTVDREYLNHAVQNDRKLYAGILRRDLETLIPELDALGLCYGEEPEFSACAFICKPGCVADYIDLEVVVEDYKRLGFELDPDEIKCLKKLMKCPILSFSTIHNIFELNYSSPEGVVETVFVGLLLGYPIESTLYFMGYH